VINSGEGELTAAGTEADFIEGTTANSVTISSERGRNRFPFDFFTGAGRMKFANVTVCFGGANPMTKTGTRRAAAAFPT
jgi:hypothetical protein